MRDDEGIVRLTPGCVHAEEDIDKTVRERRNLSMVSTCFVKRNDRLTVISDNSAATLVKRPVLSVKRINLFIAISDLTSARPFRKVSRVQTGEINVPFKPSSIPIQQENKHESDTKISSRQKH